MDQIPAQNYIWIRYTFATVDWLKKDSAKPINISRKCSPSCYYKQADGLHLRSAGRGVLVVFERHCCRWGNMDRGSFEEALQQGRQVFSCSEGYRPCLGRFVHVLVHAQVSVRAGSVYAKTARRLVLRFQC